MKPLIHAAAAFAGTFWVHKSARPNALERRLAPELRSRHPVGTSAADGQRR